MKRILTLLLLMAGTASFAAEKMVFVPQWTPQSQFAGYYVALEKGFYAEEGLDVVIEHQGMNSTESSLSKLLAGDCDILGMQLLQAIVARSDGANILNVFQLSQNCGLCCVSHTPVSSPVDMTGKTIGKWKVGFAEICDILEISLGLDINWVPFINGINLYAFGAVDAILCYSYSELVALQMAVGDIPEKQILRFKNFGYEFPEDGLYVTDSYYLSHKAQVDAFVRASKKGWDYARTHIDEALEVTKKVMIENNFTYGNLLQKRMLEAFFALLVDQREGFPYYAPPSVEVFDDAVDKLYKSGNIVRKVDYREIVR